MSNIHPLAVVSPHARVGQDVSIGPFAIIEDDVVIGDGCKIASHTVIKRGTILGANNDICEHVVIGGDPQHVNKPEYLGGLQIGSNNTFREFCTVHRAMKPGNTTTIGNNNMFMAVAHVAHDCKIGSNIICANNVLFGGHVVVEDRAFVSGAVGVHQFCRIGSLAMVGGHTKVVQDIPPYTMIDHLSGCVCGLNLVGLRRNGFTTDQIAELKAAYRIIYRRGHKWSEVLESLRNAYPTGPAAAFHLFLSSGTRGFVQERRMPPNATLKIRTDDSDAEKTERTSEKSSEEMKTKAG